jgi:O-antigen ligase
MTHLAVRFAGGGLRRRVAEAACLMLPIVMIAEWRSIADGLATLIAVVFLVDRALRRDATWLRSPWVVLAGALWGWMLLCSVLRGNAQAIVQSLVSIRLFLLTAALDQWVLEPESARSRLGRIVLFLAAWLILECWQQFFTGTNIFGDPVWNDGALTGPFFRPRAGATYLMLFFPALLPNLLRLIAVPRWRRQVIGLLVCVLGVATMVLIGQRMPTLLLLLGLCLTALMIPQFRLVAAVVIAAGATLISLLPIVSPRTEAKLVVHFTQQMGHFWHSPYGLIFTRAADMIVLNPWLGLGFDGFRDHCADPLYKHPLSWLPIAPSDIGSPAGCNIHPHNYYLLIATNAGLLGLLLFAGLAVHCLNRMGRATRALVEPRRAALFVTACIIFWPLASTSSMFTFPTAGWLFLMIGWGLAEARFSTILTDRP